MYNYDLYLLKELQERRQYAPNYLSEDKYLVNTLVIETFTITYTIF